MEKFLAATRVQERFTQPFTVAYDSFRCISGRRSCISRHHGAAAKEAPEADGAGSKTSREADVANFRAQCEVHCKQELEARVVALAREGKYRARRGLRH